MARPKYPAWPDLTAIWHEDATLTTSERAVLTVLVIRRNNKSGKCNMGIRRIAREAGMTPRGAGRILDRLAETGIIERALIPGPKGKQFRYWLRIRQSDATTDGPRSSVDSRSTLPDSADDATTLGPSSVDRQSASVDPGSRMRGPTVVRTPLNSFELLKENSVTDRFAHAKGDGTENGNGASSGVQSEPPDEPNAPATPAIPTPGQVYQWQKDNPDVADAIEKEAEKEARAYFASKGRPAPTDALRARITDERTTRILEAIATNATNAPQTEAHAHPDS